MIFKNAMSFKAKIKQIALEKGISTQQVQQNYLIEGFLAKLAQSKYNKNFIVKGGYLIGKIVGLDLRATMDLDTTIKGFELSAKNLEEIAKDIVKVPTEESFLYKFLAVEEIREMDDYPGFRLKLLAAFEKIEEQVTIDVTTGDVITPREIEFQVQRIFSEDKIELLAYPIETVLAEKIETILSRGIATTRPRDFYDVYMLSKLRINEIDLSVLLQAIENTQAKRASVFSLDEYPLILTEIRNSKFQQELWQKYQKQYAYAKNVSFDTVLAEIRNIVENVVLLKRKENNK